MILWGIVFSRYDLLLKDALVLWFFSRNFGFVSSFEAAFSFRFLWLVGIFVLSSSGIPLCITLSVSLRVAKLISWLTVSQPISLFLWGS